MAQVELGTWCPLVKKDCVGLKCAWMTKIVGYDINTGKEIEDYRCAIGWLPALLVENSGMQRQTGSAVESFRNEMVKANDAAQQLMLAATNPHQILLEKKK